MPSNYPDGVDGTHPYFNEPEEAEIIDTEAEAEAIKRLAVAQALYKVIKKEVGTGDEYNLRGVVDGIMAERFMQAKKLGLAPKSFDVEVDGEKVGTYSITTTKPKPAETHMELQVDDKTELFEWALKLGYIDVDMNLVRDHFDRTGEVPDGCELIPVTTRAVEGGKISRTSLRIDPEAVAYSLGSELGDVAYHLLGGEE